MNSNIFLNFSVYLLLKKEKKKPTENSKILCDFFFLNYKSLRSFFSIIYLFYIYFLFFIENLLYTFLYTYWSVGRYILKIIKTKWRLKYILPLKFWPILQKYMIIKKLIIKQIFNHMTIKKNKIHHRKCFICWFYIIFYLFTVRK